LQALTDISDFECRNRRGGAPRGDSRSELLTFTRDWNWGV
jgi:hypothetical protein